MDPDMVRQQEEAEDEERLRRLKQVRMPHSRQPAAAPRAPESDESFELRAEPRHVISKPSPRPKYRPVGWFAALRASLYCLIMTALGLLGGIMVGVKFELFSLQSLGIGAALGLFFGWQAIIASLRANADLSYWRALLAGILPAAIMIVALIAGMIAASQFTGITSDSIAAGDLPTFWAIVATAGFAGLVLAAMRMRKVARR